MTTIKETLQVSLTQCKADVELQRDIKKLQRQSNLNAKSRKDCVMRWAMKQLSNICPKIAKSKGTTKEMAYAVLIEHIKASPTGDFCNIKQETIAARMGRTPRTIQRAIYTLRECGILYTKHNYKNTDRGNRRTVSYTIIGAFRKHYNVMKQYLESIDGIAPFEKIMEFLGQHSQHVSKASLLKSFNKSAVKRQFVDLDSDEVFTRDDVEIIVEENNLSPANKYWKLIHPLIARFFKKNPHLLEEALSYIPPKREINLNEWDKEIEF